MSKRRAQEAGPEGGLAAEVKHDARPTGVTPQVPPAHPVFLLALPNTHSALLCSMLGRHPQMYGLPATHLFNAPTVSAWWAKCEKSAFRMADGLLRAIAQIYFGEQTDESVKAAEGWLNRRYHLTTALIFEALADRISPLVPVDGSTTLVTRPAAFELALRMFPLARFIHVQQHPRAFGESLMNGINEAAKRGPAPYWMLHLASFPGPSASEDATPHKDPGMDPQRAWYVLNARIRGFLARIPDERKISLQVEDLFAQPGPSLRRIAGCLGLGTDEDAIEAMQHPELSPFASFGPPAARYGHETSFLQNPTLPEASGERLTLDGDLSWKQDGQGFLPKVEELARELGYE